MPSSAACPVAMPDVVTTSMNGRAISAERRCCAGSTGRCFLNATPDAATMLAQIDGWFEDYNENHPHSGLKMRSPREFIRAQTSTAKVSG